MNIFIMPNLSKHHAKACTENVIALLTELDCTALMTAELAPEFSHTAAVFDTFDAVLERCDCIFAIGGDGTIIHSAKQTLVKQKPLLGINAGRLGFLSQMEHNNLDKIKQVIKGDYQIEERILLEVEIIGGTHSIKKYALNDVVLSRSTLAKIIDLEISCGDKPVISYRADGVIFSTPTGSTAYALSAGGAIIDPKIDTIAMTPICPHSLFDRSILFAPDKTIRIGTKALDGAEEVYVSVDGEDAIKLGAHDVVFIKKALVSAQFIAFEERDFYDILNQKLMFRG